MIGHITRMRRKLQNKNNHSKIAKLKAEQTREIMEQIRKKNIKECCK